MAQRRGRSTAVGLALAAAAAAALAAALAAGPGLLAPPGRLRGATAPRLCGRGQGTRGGHAWRQPQRPGVEATGLGSLLTTTGVGPAAVSIWARLAVVPPFSWINWLGVQFANAPAFYKYYIYYIVFSKLAQKLCPGIYAQIVTGTQLGIMKTVSFDKYGDAVGLRLRGLLIRQAQLNAPPGTSAPPLPPAVLEAAVRKMKQDKVLTEALGSTAALAVWHKLERTPLSDPTLLQDAAPTSQARWVLEALRKGYTHDLEAAARSGATAEAAKDAKEALQTLHEAVTAASLSSQYRLVEAGVDDSITKVQEASAAAAKAVGALQEAMTQDPAAAGQGQTLRKTWEAKAAELRATYAAVPAVAVELERLAPAATPAASAVAPVAGSAAWPRPTASTEAA
mmetsp:Transcript_7335/g.23104  ORF Transcript_7335/g.23104 Transcript_7335/m.23104 type:complete len:396 (-) Transcript_7335:93-1280(-)